MKKVFNILEQIGATTSRKEKENILKQNKDNKLLKKVFYYTYNPYYIYGIGEKSLQVKGINFIKSEFNSIFELLDYLKENNGGSNEAIIKTHSFLSVFPKDLRMWYERMILKDLKIGVTTKTINKIWKNLIPEFNVMLAKKYKDYAHKIEGKKFIITTKLDGVRATILKENGKIKIMSRQGKIFEGLIDIEQEATMLPDNYVYDGELLKINIEGLSSKELYKATTKITNSKGVKKNIEFHCFDMIPIHEFKQGKSKTICLERKEKLSSILKQNQYKYIKEVPMLYVGNDKSKIDEYLQQAIENNQEGIMINIADAPYECKRTDKILKVKVMNTVDLKVVGFQEGKGKFKNTLGRLNVKYKGNIVGIGSGFSDNMRKEIWNNQEKYLGKIVEIQYFEETYNEKGQPSLRFPVFKRWRFDKDKPSYD